MSAARSVRIQYECRRDFREKGLWTSDRPKFLFVEMLQQCGITSENTISFKVDGKDVDPKHIDTLLKEGARS